MVNNKNQNGRHSYIFTRETLGMTVLLFCGLMLLMLLTYNAVFSGLGVAVCTFMYGTFGYGSYLVLAALACLGVWLVFEKRPAVRLRTAAAVGITLAVLFMLFHAVTTRDFDMNGYGAYLAECYSSAESGFAGYTFGGVISGLIVYPIARGTTFIGAYVIFSILLALCGYLTFLVIRMDVLTRGNRRTKAAAAEQTLPAAGESVNDAADNAYVMNEGYEIVNNMANAPQAVQPEAAQPVPAEYGGYAPYGGEQQPAAQVGDLAARHDAEQRVEPVVAKGAQRAVPLDAAAFHKAGTQAAVVLPVGAVFQNRQKVGDGALVVAVQHDEMRKAVRRGVAERHLVAAAEAVVLVVAQKMHRGLGVASAPGLHGGLGAVGGAVVDDDARAHPRRDAGVQQLVQHARDLFFAVIRRDEHQQFFHSPLLFPGDRRAVIFPYPL